MLYGEPTWAPAVLKAVVRQIAAVANINPDRVFCTLHDDATLLAVPPADRFIACRPTTFPVLPAAVTGGGTLNTPFDMKVRVALFARLQLDREFRADRQMLETEGILAEWKKVIAALQMFSPADPKSQLGMTTQPVRIDPGFEITPKATKSNEPWTVVSGTFSVPFLSDLPS